MFRFQQPEDIHARRKKTDEPTPDDEEEEEEEEEEKEKEKEEKKKDDVGAGGDGGGDKKPTQADLEATEVGTPALDNGNDPHSCQNVTASTLHI